MPVAGILSLFFPIEETNRRFNDVMQVDLSFFISKLLLTDLSTNACNVSSYVVA